LRQVKPGGRLISPVEYAAAALSRCRADCRRFNGGDQRLMLYDKVPDGSVQSRMVPGDGV
jgi:hypothetical protein